ncbi:hypothetical protein [Deinococcus sp. QL22]|uniref:hypothetical protein n=1 Tax=Deinococcus sp. QL22 TaxID=2939437 RepID=UPI002018306B|nr:hypothetical protein [Deinococcus sp. QL22]UQN05534.1 hypothetical protein M1R55_11680 [Deinococcus sp. QL22]
MAGKQMAFLLLLTLLALVLVDPLSPLLRGEPFKTVYLTIPFFMVWLARTAFKGQLWARVVFVGLSLPYAIVHVMQFQSSTETVGGNGVSLAVALLYVACSAALFLIPQVKVYFAFAKAQQP